jgi:hypothetical protein
MEINDDFYQYCDACGKKIRIALDGDWIEGVIPTHKSDLGLCETCNNYMRDAVKKAWEELRNPQPSLDFSSFFFWIRSRPPDYWKNMKPEKVPSGPIEFDLFINR